MTGDILGDTNILLRSTNRLDPQHPLVVEALRQLRFGGHRILYTPQGLREFWNVATRPKAVNGLDLPTSEADAATRLIESTFTLLPDNDEMHTVWRRLVVEHGVRGVQVHDARLAASTLVGRCHAILTLNDADFRRYGVEALHPRDVSTFLTS